MAHQYPIPDNQILIDVAYHVSHKKNSASKLYVFFQEGKLTIPTLRIELQGV